MSDFLGNLTTINEYLCNGFNLLNLSMNFFELFAYNNIRIGLEEIGSLYFLLFFGITSVDFPKSRLEVLSLISFKNLLLEIRPVILWLWFSINGDDDPFKNLISFWFPVIDVYFGQSFGINFGSQVNSFLPFSGVDFLVDLDLL